MLLKVKSLKLMTGRPVAILHEKTAKKLSIFVGERVRIRNNHSLVAIVDIATGIIKENEVALSMEVLNELKISEGHKVEISSESPPKSSHYILEKLNGKELDYEKLFTITGDIGHNNLTEAEIAYFISGVYIHGMSDKEISDLTRAMVACGKRLNLKGKVYDKHCIGGIAGNRTTPLVVSICSAAGLIIPKTSSRAITSSAGTADVVECISKVEFNIGQIKNIIKKANACMVWGGALGLAPADDKIIQVERIMSLDPEAQLIASILAKKIAVNSHGVLLDIPYGNSAKVKTKADAKKLADKFEKISNILNLNVNAVLTDGSQPIGNGIGPVLEMIDIISILKREKTRPLDLEKKSIYLSGIILEMAKKAKKGRGEKLAREILESGKALKKFQQIIEAQGGSLDKKVLDKRLRISKLDFTINSEKSGKIIEIDNKGIAAIAKAAGCPSEKSSGVFLHVHVGDKIKKGHPLITAYTETPDKLIFVKDAYQRLSPIKIK